MRRPENFFRITFLTEGLKRVLTQRPAAAGGHRRRSGHRAADRVRRRQDPHDARASTISPSPPSWSISQGVGDRWFDERRDRAAGSGRKVAVFVGSAEGHRRVADPDRTGRRSTRSGAISPGGLPAMRGLKLVAEAEAARTNPGSELMVEVFKLAGPSVILLDELVAFARQLPDDRFEAFLSFIQSLTEAAKMAPGALLVGSLPESDAEAGGAKGVEALRRLEKVFGRVQSPWLPASGDETYEIIRRRLFQTLDATARRRATKPSRRSTISTRKNAAEFPPEAKESRYYELLRLSYPIHPELFDRLSKDWASLANFQRTRGVLRFMANVVGVLWHQRAPDPLITPARVPIAHERVRASVLYPLDAASRRWSTRKSTATARCLRRSRPIHRVASLKCTRRRAPRALCSSAPRRLSAAQRRPVRRRPAPGLRRARRPACHLRGGASRAEAARDLPLRGGRSLLVLDPADAEPRSRRARQGAARARGRRGHLAGSER